MTRDQLPQNQAFPEDIIKSGFHFFRNNFECRTVVSVLRKFQSPDVAQIFALHERALQATGAFIKRGPWDKDLKNIDGIYLRPGGCFYVVEENGAIIGMGALKRHENGEAEIKRMRIAPEKQRRGLGQKILDALLKTAADHGIRRVFLDTTNQQIAAQKFYAKNGFSEFDRKELRTMTMIYYEKLIDPILPHPTASPE